MAVTLIFTLLLSVIASGLIVESKDGSNNSILITEQSSLIKIGCSELLDNLKNSGQQLSPANPVHALLRLAARSCIQNSKLDKDKKNLVVGLILTLVIAFVPSVVLVVLATLLWRKRREDRTMEVELQVISITCLCLLSYLISSYLILSYHILSYLILHRNQSCWKHICEDNKRGPQEATFKDIKDAAETRISLFCCCKYFIWPISYLPVTLSKVTFPGTLSKIMNKYLFFLL